MFFNYLTRYNLMQILVEEGLHAVKTDKKTLQEFSGKFLNITDEIQNAAKDTKVEDGESTSSDVTLLSNFYDFRSNISKLNAKYISDKNINNVTNEILNNLSVLTKVGKLALMNAKDKRYYKLLISYGIKDENIVFDSDKEIVFSAI